VISGDLAARLKQDLKFGLLSFGAAAIVFAAICLVWSYDLRGQRVTLLGGSPSALSVLVTSGSARVLIATGDDPSTLTTALERARHPTTRRLDLVLVAGTGALLRGPNAIAADDRVRQILSLGQLTSSAETDAIRAAGVTPITGSKQIYLDDRVVIDLDVASGDEEAEPSWRAIVRRDETSVVILSSSDALARFGPTDPGSALVVASGGGPLQAWNEQRAPVLAFPEAAIPGARLRADMASGARPEWTVRVFAGEAVRLGLGTDGLKVPPGAAIASSSPVSARRRGPGRGGTGRIRP
jgi:hypothetical protein